jgi:hypothetical protein
VVLLMLTTWSALESNDGDTGSEHSSPFTVSNVPDGYERISTGRGTREQVWGDDATGTSDEPFTVLAPTGAGASSARMVLVSLTGFRGHQGGLDQAANGGAGEEISLDGRRGIYTTGGSLDQVLVIVGEDLALRIAGHDRSKEDLLAIARAVTTDGDRRHAPVVSDPPLGLRVIGSADAGLSMALASYVSQFEGGVPGPDTAHGAGWVQDDGASWGSPFLAVATLPGSSVQLAAVPAITRIPGWTRHDVSPGADGLVRLEWVGADPEVAAYGYRAVAFAMDNGDVVVVVAGGSKVPSLAEVERVAHSVRPISESAWQRVGGAQARRPLEPDVGAIELERGRIDDVAWLLQARRAEDLSSGSGPNASVDVSGIPLDAYVIDPCLKLSNGRRQCAGSGSSGRPGGELVAHWSGVGFGEPTFPPFVIVSTATGGSTLRITTRDGSFTGVLYALPGERLRGGIVFVERPGLASCVHPDDPRVPSSLDVMFVEVLDEIGSFVGCVGLEPG